MKTKYSSTLDIRHSAFTACGTALVAAITLFGTSPPASAQTGPGYALSFNGTNAYVAVTPDDIPRFTFSYTIEAWIKPNRMTNGGILGWGSYGTANGVNVLTLRTNGLANSWGANDLVVVTNLAGQWHHVAASYDLTYRRIYVDGILKATDTNPPPLSVPTATNVTIGKVTAADYFDGSIDEVRLWNSARSADQIRTNMYNALKPPFGNLLGSWRFDAGAGTDATNDVAAAYNNGTLVNNPVWIRSGVPFVPEGVTTNATSITTASARLNARVHPGNLASKAWFQWGTTTNYGTNTPQISVPADVPADLSAPFEIGSVLTNLILNTKYYFRVAVTNTVGTNYGAQAYFTTESLPTGPSCALTFNGTNNYVMTPDLTAFFPNTNVTIELWFLAHGPGVLVNELGSYPTVAWHDSQIEVVTTATNSAYADVRVRVWPLASPGIVVGQVQYGTWNHVALSYNQTNAILAGFLNGVPGSPTTVSRQAPHKYGYGLFYGIGMGDSEDLGSGAFFDGQIDEFRLWNVARNTNDIQAYLSRPLAGNEPGLVAYWQFDKCAGTVASDTTGHGNDGTLYGPNWTNSTVQFGPWIATLPATNLTTTSAVLKGTVSPQGFATTAWFQWGTTTNYGNTTAVTNAGSGTISLALSTNIAVLASFANYHFRAVASNSYGVSYGADQSFWLGPPLVTTLPAFDITTSAATLDSDVIASGPSAQAWFQWGTNTSYGNNTVQVPVGPGTVPVPVTNRLSGLVPGATYHYRVVATNGFGPAYGDDRTVTNPFVAQVAALAGKDWSALVWGDFDMDGDLDIVLSGQTGPETRLYRNDAGTFNEVTPLSLTDVAYGSFSVGDYDSDGWPDILLTGSPGGTTRVAEVWRNTGGGWSLTASLTGVANSSAVWGDYDNDGRLDILVSGSSSSGPIARVYRNFPTGTFTDIGAGLPGVYYSSAAWGDFDNDGRLDILLAGAIDATNYILRVYHNNGNGTFTLVPTALPGVCLGAAVWGDYDNDGDLDILLAGLTASGRIASVYRNNGNGTFTDINAGLPGVGYSSAAWGDFDNDGRLDIALMGLTTPDESGPLACIYHNNGDNTFTAIPTAGLIGSYKGSLAVGDFDKDGRLDIATAGWYYATRIYRNYWPTTNNPSTAPANLVATVTGTNALLTWSPAIDSKTPSPGLSYNLRLGTAPGISNVIDPLAAGNGWRRVPQLGNLQQNLSVSLAGLHYGSNYYWSVQAVDPAFAGSPFANEVMFTVTRAPSASAAEVGSVMGNSAVVGAWIYPNGSPTTAYIQWGTTPSYGNSTAEVDVGSGTSPVPLRQTLTGLQAGAQYHYRIVTSNANGTTYGPDQTFYMDPAVLLGDANGDGIVDQAELDAVLAGYWPTSPWLCMTNPAGLGGTNVTFALTNSTAGAYSVWMSTNLAGWDYLGPATPRYEFTDTNAPAVPQRFYRLQWP